MRGWGFLRFPPWWCGPTPLGQSARPLNTRLATGVDLSIYLWNTRLRSFRGVVERAFGVLKGRFRCLLGVLQASVPVARDTILVCFILHNFLLRRKDSVRHEELLREGGYQPMQMAEILGEAPEVAEAD